MSKKKKDSKEEVKTVLDVLPIRFYDEDLGGFLLEDGSYMDLYEIVPSDRSNLQGDELDYNVMNFTRFLRLYSADIKFISMNFPISTSPQRRHLEKRLEKCTDMVRKLWLEREINELALLDQNIMRREYYLMYFSNDAESFIKNKTNIKKYVGYGRNKLVDEIDMEKKIQISTKLCNMNTLILPDDLKEYVYDED